MNPPSQAFENMLTQSITIPRSSAGVVRAAVTFDTNQVASRSSRVNDGKINSVARAPDLRMNYPTICS